MFFCVTTISYGFAFTLPIILSTKLKFSVAMAQCMGAPPYAASGLMMYGAAWFSDKVLTLPLPSPNHPTLHHPSTH